MPTPNPLYTVDNCRPAYQLNWSLAIFWKQPAIDPTQWLEPLKQATEPDDVRVLEHRLTHENVSQFLLSTKPHVSPAATIRSIKGRLQHLIRKQLPKAFRRNYSIHSVGSANRETIENYLASQLDHHRMADVDVQQQLEASRFNDPSVDLSQVRRSSYGEFIYNLQIVFVHRDRGVDVRTSSIETTYETIRRIAHKRNHLLSKATVLADHLHVAIACDIVDTPSEVALAYMNNLAYAHGQKAAYQYSYFAGTFGRYDLQAVRRSLDTSSRRDEPGGDSQTA